MGGEGTGVAPETTDVLLESAWFAPGAIAGRARRYGLQTDASMRFERGVDPTRQEAVLERATELLLSMAGGRAGPVVVHQAGPAWQSQVLRLRRNRLRQVLGAEIPDGEVVRILTALGMSVTEHPEGWEVSPPAFRFDMGLEVDLIEEVARVHGYDRIPAVAGHQTVQLGSDTESRVRPERVRQLLVDRGYQEAITYSFTDPDLDSRMAGGTPGTRLVNPIASDLAVMRQSLWPGLLGALRHNLSRQQERVRFFEIGSRFLPQDNDVKEEKVVSGVAYGPVLPEQWGAPAVPTDFFDIKSDLEALLGLARTGQEIEFQPAAHPALHPGQSARLVRGTEELGWLGALHPAIVAELELAEAPVLFELDLDRVLRSGIPAISAPSRFPAVRRDLAVLVERDLPVAALRASVTAAAGPVLRDLIVFDVYAGERVDPGVKSVALGLILQETSRTLTDVEVDAIVGGVVSRLTTDFNARIRE
jgi:phenylalanyl-tRNA synthetase beta chain